MAWKTNQRAWKFFNGFCLFAKCLWTEILQLTYSKTICVGTESHNIVVAVRRLTSETRFTQTLRCNIMIEWEIKVCWLTAWNFEELSLREKVSQVFKGRIYINDDSHAHLTSMTGNHAMTCFISFTTTENTSTTFNIKCKWTTRKIDSVPLPYNKVILTMYTIEHKPSSCVQHRLIQNIQHKHEYIYWYLTWVCHSNLQQTASCPCSVSCDSYNRKALRNHRKDAAICKVHFVEFTKSV